MIAGTVRRDWQNRSGLPQTSLCFEHSYRFHLGRYWGASKQIGRRQTHLIFCIQYEGLIIQPKCDGQHYSESRL